MNLIDGLLIAGILIVLLALVGPVLVKRKPKARIRSEAEIEIDKAADAAKKLFAEKVGLTLALLLLTDRIDRMRRQALSLPVPDDNPLSDIGREKRTILEQIRIADYSCREIAVAMAKFDSTTLEAVRWPFTSAELQLSFAQRRLDSWPPIPRAETGHHTESV
jgi:hypothetical protein